MLLKDLRKSRHKVQWKNDQREQRECIQLEKTLTDGMRKDKVLALSGQSWVTHTYTHINTHVQRTTLEEDVFSNLPLFLCLRMFFDCFCCLGWFHQWPQCVLFSNQQITFLPNDVFCVVSTFFLIELFFSLTFFNFITFAGF